MTRDDIVRRLADAVYHSPRLQATRRAHLRQVFDALRVIAREPGGAEAVAEAVGLRAEATVWSWKDNGTQDVPARIVAAAPKEPCVCHAGSVCDDACDHGAHHGGRDAGTGTAPKEPTP